MASIKKHWAFFYRNYVAVHKHINFLDLSNFTIVVLKSVWTHINVLNVLLLLL